MYPELVQYVEGKPKTVLYQQLPAIMLNELQKQHRQIQELTERLAQLEQVLTAQRSFALLPSPPTFPPGDVIEQPREK